MTESIEEGLQENELISDQGFCTHPESVVVVDLTDETPVYRPQSPSLVSRGHVKSSVTFSEASQSDLGISELRIN